MNKDSLTSTHEEELETILRELRYSNERYRIAEQNSSEIILDYDIEKDTMFHAAKKVESIYGVPQKIDHALEYLVTCGAVLPESTDDFLELFRKVQAGVPQARCTIRTKTLTGTILWNEIIMTTVFNKEGRPVRAIGVLRDITRQMDTELEYKKELLYHDVLRKYALLSYEADLSHRKVLSGLDKTLAAMGIPYSDEYDDALGKLAQYIVWPEDRGLILSMFSVESLMEQYNRGHDKVECEYRRIADGLPLWVRCTVYITYDKSLGIVRAVYYIHDINEAKMEEMKLREKAEQDLLTGLYNKMTTEQLIKKALETEHQEGRVSAFIIVDLDNFKNVNDQLGHVFGDAVLSEFANKLKGQCRADDIAGRIGGDEFVLFLKNLPNRETAELKGQNICTMFKNAYAGALSEYKISGSVGISILPAHGKTFDELYTKADIALYAAKKQGKDVCLLYDDSLSGDEDQTVRSTKEDIGNVSAKAFADNIIEYVFRILYESKDLNKAIYAVLELISKHFNFSRGYIYEFPEHVDKCVNTFEWCNPGTVSLSDEMGNLSPSLLAKYEDRFFDNHVFLAHTDDCLFPEESCCPLFQDIQLRIQFSLLSPEHKFTGFIGFDQYSDVRHFPLEDLAALEGAVQMLDTFLREQRAGERQSQTETILQAVADSWRTCTYVIDPDTYTLQFVDQNTKKLIPDAVPGAVCYDVIRGNSEPCDDCPFINMMCEDLREYKTQMYLSPYLLWAKIHATLVEVGKGKDYGIFNGYDFTEYKNTSGEYIVDADAFTRDVALYRALTHSTDDYIFMCDVPKNLFYFPPTMVEEFDLPGSIVEDAIPLWCSLIHENEQAPFMENITDILTGKTIFHDLEYRAQNKNGRWIWLHCRGYVENGEDGKPSLFAGIITNLGRKSKIDYLTGLPNKYEFEQFIRSQLSDHPEGGELLLLGLDNFKNINNLYGLEFGDHIIQESAQKIQSMYPEIQLYRLDGDCFGMYVNEHCGQHAERIYHKISKAFNEQQQYGNQRYYCTVSGGYSTTGTSKVSFNTLFKQAEFALEHSKAEGKNHLNRYSVETMGGKERSLRLIELLRDSIDHGCENFELYYQPQIRTSTRIINSAEALLRWNCHEFGQVSPIEFIPLLEQTGLIQKVGKWVLLKAGETCKDWRKTNPDFAVNVNLSYAQLQDRSFIPFLEKAIKGGKIDPKGIHLELTESCIAAGSKSVTDAFLQLRNMGFCIEMDDFGTGYSSLEILKNAPTDVVKIDRVFVSDITTSDFDATFIQFVVALCHSVNILVCLEGVETWEEYQMVESMDVDLIQGYLFGKPQTRKDFEEKYLNGDDRIENNGTVIS